MKIKCPKCKQRIEPDQINMASDLAFCEPCNEAFKISETIGEEPPDESVLKNPPKGAWVGEGTKNIVVGATTRSPAAFFLVPFTGVWAGGSMGGIYGTQIMSGEFNLIMSLFGLPFLVGSIFLISITLMTVFGKTEVSIGPDSFVFNGIGPFGLKKRFDWLSVKSIREGVSASGSDTAQNTIFIEGAKRIKVGTGLNEERRFFMLNVLKYIHAKTRS